MLDTFSPNKNDINYITNKYSYMNDTTGLCGICIYNFGQENSYLNESYFSYLQSRASGLFQGLTARGITKYVVFTNDLQFMQNALQKILGSQASGLTIYVPTEKDYIQIWMMSLLKINIVSHTQVSWWGAYLNKIPNKVVYYLNYFDTTSTNINIKPGWIIPM
jgi:hypothetical protein